MMKAANPGVTDLAKMKPPPGYKSALDAYIAAVYPAGPEPIIKHLIFSILSDITIFYIFQLSKIIL